MVHQQSSGLDVSSLGSRAVLSHVTVSCHCSESLQHTSESSLRVLWSSRLDISTTVLSHVSNSTVPRLQYYCPTSLQLLSHVSKALSHVTAAYLEELPADVVIEVLHRLLVVVLHTEAQEYCNGAVPREGARDGHRPMASVF